jgi:hypothetical protein
MIAKLLDSCLGPVIAAEKQLKRRQLVIAILAIGAIGCAVLAALALFASWWSWPAVSRKNIPTCAPPSSPRWTRSPDRTAA